MRALVLTLTFLFFSGVITIETVQARPKYLFKIASLAPEGSIWVNQFQKFIDEVAEKTGGEVGFRIYPGGIMGDDQAMYRKMRVGQLHGGGFTMTGIASVVPDFRIMSIPFLFHSYSEVDVVREGLLPLFRDRFNAKGMELVAMTEVGFIYTMSTTPIATIPELMKTKSWIPAGDPLAAAFLEEIGISPVQLSIPDVLSSLQTGLVDTVYNSLYGAIVLQWFTKAQYITDTPFGYAYGVFLLDKKRFDRLPAAHAEVIKTTARKYFSTLIDETRRSNTESRRVMEQRGVEFIAADRVSVKELEMYRDQAVEKQIGSAFSPESYEQMMTLLNSYRNSTSTE